MQGPGPGSYKTASDFSRKTHGVGFGSHKRAKQKSNNMP